jgi:hypothetical protein
MGELEVLLSQMSAHQYFAFPYWMGLLVAFAAMFVVMIVVFLFVMGWDGNKFSYKLFRQSRGVLVSKVFADETMVDEFRKNLGSDDGYVHFNSSGKDAIQKSSQHLNWVYVLRDRKYGVPRILMIEGEPENSNWLKARTIETSTSKLNAIAKIRAHELGVLEGMLASKMNNLILIIILLLGIGALIAAIIGAYYSNQNAEALKTVISSLQGLTSSMAGVKASVGSTGAGVLVPA